MTSSAIRFYHRIEWNGSITYCIRRDRERALHSVERFIGLPVSPAPFWRGANGAIHTIGPVPTGITMARQLVAHEPLQGEADINAECQ